MNASMREVVKQISLLESLADRHGTAVLRKRYNAAVDALLRSLRAQARKSTSRVLDPAMTGTFLPRIRAAQLTIAKGLSSDLAKVSKIAQRDGIRSAVDQIERFEEQFAGRSVALSLNDAAEMDAAIQQDRVPIERDHDQSMMLVMTTLGSALANQIIQSGLRRGATAITLDNIEDLLDSEFWKIERIARTEIASAYNLGMARGVAVGSKEVGEIGLRWCEKVDDQTGKPLDNRVAEDSLVLHGQVAFNGYNLPSSARTSAQLVGGFEMPQDPRVRSDWWGRRYIRPPNRPYDRAVGQPWSSRWGVPAYRMVRGERIPL
jgi:hypothetical protein